MTGGGGPDGAQPAIGEFDPIEGTMAEYEMASDLTGIFVNPPEGLVIHYAGPIGAMVLSGSLWAARQNALDFFAGRAGEGLTEFVHRLTAPQRDPNLSYQLKPVEQSVIGPRAGDFEVRPRGSAKGAVLIRTVGAELPPATSPELIVAVRLGELDDHTLYEFRATAPNDLAEAAEVIQLHSIFTTAPGLAVLSES
ncbi:MAG: hypothetical protein JHC98_03640 [Thermoleophilaceae bacterium]|nr:hypothetical protein [Thermoleophilaceae bacterium]